MKIDGKEYSRKEIERRIGNINQLGGTLHYQFSEGRAKGVSGVEFNTGTGFSFTVIPDRGLDIAQCTYRGMNLVYHTPNGVVSPKFYEPGGFGWLRTFFAGLLATCGLTYFGPPGRDGDEDLGLHGRYSTIPADKVCDLSRWDGDDYILEITGVVEECVLFGDKLRLTRTISTGIGKKYLRIRDTVQNFGFKTSPFTILYHINAGFPLLDDGSELMLTSIENVPYDEVSTSALEDSARFTPPIPGFGEQNYLHTMAGDEKGFASAALINRNLLDGLGLYIRFHTGNLVYLSEWKMMGEGDYVLGLEPCNTKIDNRASLRKDNRLPVIEPGEIKEMEVEIGVLDGQEEIDKFSHRVKEITSSGSR
ncbi:MAG TPA: DUF4432 family protein [Spirochaetes bacterium]|nr:DUF4432 family protein [Spirochaetota bacterium]